MTAAWACRACPTLGLASKSFLSVPIEGLQVELQIAEMFRLELFDLQIWT
jgi:hypothetical protein